MLALLGRGRAVPPLPHSHVVAFAPSNPSGAAWPCAAAPLRTDMCARSPPLPCPPPGAQVMRKDRILERDHRDYVRAERDVLTAVLHPYIVTLRYSFQVGGWARWPAR